MIVCYYIAGCLRPCFPLPLARLGDWPHSRQARLLMHVLPFSEYLLLHWSPVLLTNIPPMHGIMAVLL